MRHRPSKSGTRPQGTLGRIEKRGGGGATPGLPHIWERCFPACLGGLAARRHRRWRDGSKTDGDGSVGTGREPVARERAQFMRMLTEWQAERQAVRQADRARNGNSRGPMLLSELSVSAADLAMREEAKPDAVV